MRGIPVLPKANEIFVFGSNLAGIHGSDAAKHAQRFYKAEPGHGRGRTGNAYAIPTKDMALCILSLSDIQASVTTFIKYARGLPDLSFKVVAIGCGLAGYQPTQIAPMFRGCPSNCILPPEFVRVIRGLTTVE
jgi:hypothetical protein